MPLIARPSSTDPGFGQEPAEGMDDEDQLNDGPIPHDIADLKPHRERDEAFATCIDYFKANNERIR